MGVHTGARAVFLDRDGVINRPIIRDGKPHPPGRLEELEILPGVAAALIRLHLAGFRLVVVTNQPDIARGQQDRELVDTLHARLRSQLPIDEVRVCAHDDRDHCECRKPKDGLLQAAARESGLSLEASFMIGDRWRDIEAGRRAGCKTIFVDWSYREKRPVSPDVVVKSLPDAVDWILSQTTAEGRPI
jgi:D-glycero-D-manno-heptose 1,7-bisphosphate phosphatase